MGGFLLLLLSKKLKWQFIPNEKSPGRKGGFLFVLFFLLFVLLFCFRDKEKLQKLLRESEMIHLRWGRIDSWWKLIGLMSGEPRFSVLRGLTSCEMKMFSKQSVSFGGVLNSCSWEGRKPDGSHLSTSSVPLFPPWPDSGYQCEVKKWSGSGLGNIILQDNWVPPYCHCYFRACGICLTFSNWCADEPKLISFGQLSPCNPR